MKKGYKILIILFSLLLFSGCVKENVEMNINANKSMDVTIIVGLNKSMLGDSVDSSSIFNSNTKDLEDKGFKVEDYNDDTYKGYKLTKHFDNIDNVNADEILNFTTEKNTGNTFEVNKGFLINKYNVSLKNFSSSSINSSSMVDSSIDDSMSSMSSTYLSMMDLKFVLKVPYKTTSNNATTVEDDGKTLTWNLANLGNNSINFEFNMFNIVEAIILVGAGILVFVLIIIAIIKSKNKKQSNSLNIEPTPNNIDTPNIESIQNNIETPNIEVVDNNVEVVENNNPQVNMPTIDNNVQIPQNNVEQVHTSNNNNSNDDIEIV